jgi:hypothetical protein
LASAIADAINKFNALVIQVANMIKAQTEIDSAIGSNQYYLRAIKSDLRALKLCQKAEFEVSVLACRSGIFIAPSRLA